MTVMRALLSALLITSVGLTGACGDETDEPTDVAPFLVANAGIETAYWYQVSQVPLLLGGQTVTTRHVPIIQLKDARLEVTIRTAANAEGRSVIARVSISGTVPTTVDQQVELVPGDATDVSFLIPGMSITDDAAISIGLYESDDIKRDGDTSVSRWPRDLDMPLDARDPGGLRLTVVPIRPNATVGGDFDVTPEMMAEIESDMLAQLPINSVELVAHAPVDWTDDLGEISSWNEVVLLLANLREQEGADPDMYYYGLIPWSVNLALGGLAATLSDAPFWRVSIGVQGERSNVLLHEVMHVLGRRHTPCGDPGGPDPFYPYDEALIGPVAYDAVNDEWVDPLSTHDTMSYCSPSWTSDYTYTALFQEIRAVNEQTTNNAAPPTRELVHVYNLSDGAMKNSGTHRLVVPSHTRVSINGEERDVGIVSFHDSPGKLMLSREPLDPGAVLRSTELGTFKLAGGAR